MLATELLLMDEEYIWQNFNTSVETFRVECVDGYRDITGTQLILSWYGLSSIRELPLLANYATEVLTLEHSHKHLLQDITKIPVRVNYLYDAEVFNSGNMLVWLGYIRKSVWSDLGGLFYPEEISKLTTRSINKIYNMHVGRISEYVGTMDLFDELRIVSDPRIRKAVDECDGTQEGVAYVQQVAKEVLDDKEGLLSDCNLVRQWKAGLPKKIQAMQTVGMVGHRTEGDSTIFPKAVLGSFAGGLGDLEDVMKESCSAKKAMIMQADPVAATEWFARRVQIVSAYVHKLVRSKGRTTELHDCGSREYIRVKVTKYTVRNLEGNYYCTDEDPTEKLIDIKDESILNTTINLRSPAKCGYRHHGTVCGRCMGEVSWSLMPDAVLGHQSAIQLNEPTTQSVISTKHEDGAATGSDLVIPSRLADILMLSSDNKGISITEKLSRGWDIIIPSKALPSPSDLRLDPELKKITPINFSEVTSVAFIERSTGKYLHAKVAMQKTPAYFSSPFLRYLTTTKIQVKEQSYRVSLDNFRTGEALFRFPLKHRNTLDFMKDMERMLEAGTAPKMKGNVTDVDRITSCETIDEAVAITCQLAWSKFDINISHIGVLLLARLTRSSTDMNIPKLGEPYVFSSLGQLIQGRSLVSWLSSDKQQAVPITMSSYDDSPRPGVAMDILLR